MQSSGHSQAAWSTWEVRTGAVQRHSEFLKALVTCSFQCFNMAMLPCCAGWFAPNKIARQKSIILHGQVHAFSLAPQLSQTALLPDWLGLRNLVALSD